MKIGEAAMASGASPRALRLYEHQGLIVPGRCNNGYRDYCPSTVDRVRAVRALLDSGLPVKFINRVLPTMLDGDGALDAGVREELAAYHHRLAERIGHLERRRFALGQFLAGQDV